MKNVRYGYMCNVDFDCELGEAWGGNRIFSSIKDAKAHRKCWKEDGIVKVKITQVRIVVKEYARRAEGEGK